MVFLRKYIPIFLSIMLLAYYLLLAWVLHRTGYEHSESLFLAEKLRLLVQAKENTLLTVGTTFPSLVFMSSLLFAPFGYPFAPIFASSALTTLLFYLLMKDFSRSNIQRRFFIPMICLLFVFHPGLIFSGVSGRGVAAVLLFFYLTFRSLFIYYKTQTTFSLSMASIYLTCLVFCNYHFIWLLLAFIPFIVLISLDGLKQAKAATPILQYYNSINNRSQRRKLANRTVAIYIILFLLPLVALGLFRMLNFLHAGDANYFLTSQYANWGITGKESIGNIVSNGNETMNTITQTQLVFQGYILLLTPLLIFVFAIFKGKVYEMLTLFAPFVLIAIVLLDNQSYLTVEYYLIFLVLALIGIYYYAGKKYSSRIIYPLITLVSIINIYTGILYFKRSGDVEERSFFTAIKNASKWRGDRAVTEEYRVATYISSLANINNKILIDDAAAYAIVAHLKTLEPVVLPINRNFITVAENPSSVVKYLCVAKEKNRLKSFTVLNDYNLKQLKLVQNITTTIMFETENWAVYRLNTQEG